MKQHDEKAGKCSSISRQANKSTHINRLHGQDTPWNGGPQHQHKEQKMETHEAMHMQAQLEDIRRQIHNLTAVEWRPDQEERIQQSLSRIWDVTCDLHRRLAGPDLLAGYRDDALDQIGRVMELINASEGSPDDRQLIAIDYACDLAQEKIKLYQRMANQAAQMEVLTGRANDCSPLQAGAQQEAA